MTVDVNWKKIVSFYEQKKNLMLIAGDKSLIGVLK